MEQTCDPRLFTMVVGCLRPEGGMGLYAHVRRVFRCGKHLFGKPEVPVVGAGDVSGSSFLENPVVMCLNRKPRFFFVLV
jgi:hypothetical protein